MLAHRYDPQLAQLADGIGRAVSQVASTLSELRCGADWLSSIAQTLTPEDKPSRSSSQVAQELQDVLDQLTPPEGSPALHAFRSHLHKVSRSYWPGLFHWYDHVDIPRSNNAMESHFRETQRRLLRTRGQRGARRRSLHRFGAWELLPRRASAAACVAAFAQITPAQREREQQRMHQHLERFRLHTRSRRQTTTQLNRVQQQWLELPPTSTG